MPDLFEKQLELGGVVFGMGTDIEIATDGFGPGGAVLRTNDTPLALGDGQRFGEEQRDGPTWRFDLFTNCNSEAEAWAALARLKAVWDGDDVRREAGPVLPLRYRLAGRTRTIYGRPRNWSLQVGSASLSGNIGATCDFATVSPLIFGDYHSETFGFVQEFEPDAGWTMPVVFPFTSSAGVFERTTEIVVGGEKPTPVIVTFTGPVSEAGVRIGDWSAEIVEDVVAGNPVTLDARPWVRAATTSGGGGVKLSPRVTRLSKMFLAPGSYEVTLYGRATDSAATATVSWQDAYSSPR